MRWLLRDRDRGVRQLQLATRPRVAPCTRRPRRPRVCDEIESHRSLGARTDGHHEGNRAARVRTRTSDDRCATGHCSDFRGVYLPLPRRWPPTSLVLLLVSADDADHRLVRELIGDADRLHRVDHARCRAGRGGGARARRRAARERDRGRRRRAPAGGGVPRGRRSSSSATRAGPSGSRRRRRAAPSTTCRAAGWRRRCCSAPSATPSSTGARSTGCATTRCTTR